jgi:RNA polymerase sigma-70 factor (ECF subfamily)
MKSRIVFSDEVAALFSLKVGNQQAFEYLFECHHAKLFIYCFRFVKSKDLADEIVQETFIKVWNFRERIDLQYTFTSLLFKIAFNSILDFQRKVARDASLQKEMFFHIQQSHNRTEDELIYQDLERLSKQAIEQMPEQQRLVFEMSRDKGMSHEEIATALGISPNTVKVHIFNSLKHIRNFLQQNTDVSFIILLSFLTRRF